MDATVHDSVLVEVDARDVEDAAREAERIMVAASVAVLGEPLRVDRRIVLPGQRLLEDGGPTETWNRIWRLLAEPPPAALFRGDQSVIPADGGDVGGGAGGDADGAVGAVGGVVGGVDGTESPPPALPILPRG
jgi:hypothetical protein